MDFTWRQHKRIDEIKRTDFDALISPDPNFQTPFLSFEFLHALEVSNSVGPEHTGWFPNHIAIYDDEQLIAFIPAYKKSHSYGEYIFDHSWANAYHQHGYPYYPKLVIGIPFTPVTGNRFLVASKDLADKVQHFLSQNIALITQAAESSTCHVLFPNRDASENLKEQQILQRLSVQFIWQNNNYSDYSGFIDSLTSRRRRSIRKERANIEKQNVTVKRLTGYELTPEVQAAFYECYQETYLKRSGHTGYLTEAFFEQIFLTMNNNIMIVAAYEDEQIIASSLFFYNDQQLFGRYWGALTDVSGLHFECCYYQGIEFAIEQNIQTFNPGTQGEHKILRGFSPTLCYSNHYIAHPEFNKAIKHFLDEEAQGITAYKERASTVLPYKQDKQELKLEKTDL
ncbi:GNAT family N-acetyltransferase [Glaciecola sp. KUL10]|uniref:GNAT family N-acetyltransferase n=1 Tax=Glaciecola sp. (strain KUL10) TaxID=2161813 RepID=UPI000D782599|nr:GNAT family N-acetyltransferase [Glaciecola sp. KUL10]GBL04016.1 hypothetical protein KUL10_13210 [Glaciecola sp. KUL10]